MKLNDKTVCLLFRQPGRFFSMERIFHQLDPLLGNRINVSRWYAGHSRFAPGHLLSNIRSASKNKADVYHVTGDVHYVVLGLPSRRVLLTIHDCVFLYRSTGLKRKLLKWILLDLPVRRSRLITTISEATKRDVIKYTGCAEDKVVVIPDPVNDTIYHVEADFREDNPILLFIGTTINKNLPRVASALEGIRCRLDIVGKLSGDQEEALRRYKIQFSSQAGLSDQEMAGKYVNADIILFPSTFEGFGLPIVEGQKAGRVVITSNLDPMKETAGGAACLIDPFDSASIRAGVIQIIRDKAYREQLIRDGLINAERFNAESIAGKYLACYDKIINS